MFFENFPFIRDSFPFEFWPSKKKNVGGEKKKRSTRKQQRLSPGPLALYLWDYLGIHQPSIWQGSEIF